jgi:hypothetical protein
VNLQAWRIEAFTAGAKASAGSGASASSADPFADAGFPSEPVFDSNNNAGGGDDNDDLPF